MEESILLSIKKLLGLDGDYQAFDEDVVVHINTALSILRQLGIGPKNGFKITGSNETWGDFLGDSDKLEMAKTFVYTRVKPIFDPPSNSFVLSALKEESTELAWRLNIAAEEDLETLSDEETSSEEDDGL